jgi:hypothetical protein
VIGFVAHFGYGFESSQETLNDWNIESGELLPGHVAVRPYGKLDD